MCDGGMTDQAVALERWALFGEIAHSVRAYVRRRVSDPLEAEEVYQDICLLVFEHDSGPEDIKKFASWCYALSRHALSHHFRSKRRRANLMKSIAADAFSIMPTHDITPERTVSARQALARLSKSLDQPAAELLSRRYLLGQSAHEIAERESATAVRMRLMRLRSTAKRKFAAERAG